MNGQPRKRNRGASSASAMLSGLALSLHHPALSLLDFLDTFGPLVFPIFRAALVRKRILLVGPAPVEQMCNFGRLSPRSDCVNRSFILQSMIFLSCRESRPTFLIYYLWSLSPLVFDLYSLSVFMIRKSSRWDLTTRANPEKF